jgi:hypothetical protein
VLVILPSPTLELRHAPLPLKVLRAKERALTPCSSAIFILGSHLSLSRNLGACQIFCNHLIMTLFVDTYIRLICHMSFINITMETYMQVL